MLSSALSRNVFSEFKCNSFYTCSCICFAVAGLWRVLASLWLPAMQPCTPPPMLATELVTVSWVVTMPSSSPEQPPHVITRCNPHNGSAQHLLKKNAEVRRKPKTPRRCLCSQSEQIFNDMIKCIVFDPLVYSTSPFRLWFLFSLLTVSILLPDHCIIHRSAFSSFVRFPIQLYTVIAFIDSHIPPPPPSHKSNAYSTSPYSPSHTLVLSNNVTLFFARN